MKRHFKPKRRHNTKKYKAHPSGITYATFDGSERVIRRIATPEELEYLRKHKTLRGRPM